MPIQSLEIQNVLVFQHPDIENPSLQYHTERDESQDAFRLNFCNGINVIIGENGVGKTSVLKMLYAAAQQSILQSETGKTTQLLHFFSEHLNNHDVLKNAFHAGYSGFSVSNGAHIFQYTLSDPEQIQDAGWRGQDIHSVFIPTTEMLSHSKGFLALYHKYNMPFDGTQVDIIVNASLPEAKTVTPEMREILETLGAMIHGTVIQEQDIFYVLKEDGRKLDFSLEAEGFRKFGLLWKLVRNGLLEPGAVLLWDEPEANLNPELYPALVEVLLKLQEHGVQIFLATHSYNFAAYLELRRKTLEQVMFHNLYWDGPIVCSSSAHKMDALLHNHIILADEKLLDEIYTET